MPGASGVAEKTLSIVIPVYNEERTVAQLLDKVLEAPLPIGKQIVIVNDGSTDGSPAIIRAWAESHKDEAGIVLIDKENGGKGSAVREGIKRSSGDVVIVQDADLEYDPSDYARCVEPILKGECKVVYGSREASNRNRIYSSPAFYLGGLSLTCWINLLYGSDLTDEPTCYKTFDGPLIRALPLEGDKFDWEPEVTSKLLRLGYEIKEVPVSYHPRKVSEGKKIKWKDGVEGFLVSLKWRFRSLEAVRASLFARLPSAPALMRERSRRLMALGLVVALACVLRLVYATPGISDPHLLFRPDSASYLGPAEALLRDGAYETFPGSGIPALMRTPGYPLYLATLLFIGKGSLGFVAGASAFLGGLICLPIFLCGRFFGGWRTGFIAALLFALNPTAIALSPMFLSDSLFCLLAALQLHFFLRFYRSKFAFHLLIAVALAALGALVRPLNQLWILPCIFMVCTVAELPWRLKFAYSAAALALFMAILAPWLCRNKLQGAGWRLDAVSADVLLHNASALQSRIEGKSGEAVRERLKAEIEAEFARNPAAYPDPVSKLSFQERKMAEIILAHPAKYALLHLRPHMTMLPDIPSFLENLGLSQGGKGTWDVINREGVLAGAKHYFGGNWKALALAAPLLFIVAVSYLLFGWGMLSYAMRLDWRTILLFLLFMEYYIFLPGPVSMPRYQLPALPFLCLVAAAALESILRRVKRGKETQEAV